MALVSQVVEAVRVDGDDVFLEEEDLGEVEVVDGDEEGVLLGEVVEHPQVFVRQQREARG